MPEELFGLQVSCPSFPSFVPRVGVLDQDRQVSPRVLPTAAWCVECGLLSALQGDEGVLIMLLVTETLHHLVLLASDRG